MSTPRYHLDSNVLVRFFTGDPPEMFSAATALIQRAGTGEVILELCPLVLAETAFTLESFYRHPRKRVATTLADFVRRSGVRLAERELMLDALDRVQRSGVHLVDAYLAASASQTKIPVASFDADLDRFKDIERFEPAV
ncbi:MAG: type II toxin-antitoxin system VapC family toxin [Acidobacteria bacterium]|nr:MAG: type II toxin-antitoxin system VapC family toxin [Acidobacteriota bacterium]